MISGKWLNIWIYKVDICIKFLDKYTKESAKAIFDELDINKSGKVKTDHFVEYVSKQSTKQRRSHFNKFYELMSRELVSKSEKIILKLKKIKHKAYIANDSDTLDDIDW
jgi:Ca2+-binding EF-hand superfamily protein